MTLMSACRAVSRDFLKAQEVTPLYHAPIGALAYLNPIGRQKLSWYAKYVLRLTFNARPSQIRACYLL